MSAGPRRRAFLLGCNSEGLEHCERDAEGLAKALKARDWDTRHCHTSSELAQYCQRQDSPLGPTGPADVATNALSAYLDECGRGDSILIYFSGHSRFANGVFDLVLGDDINQRVNRLSIETLISLLKGLEKPAERLLVLDCCDAAQAVTKGYWNQQAGDWVRIWVATRRNEHAMELDGDTGGGLFTAQILRILDSPSAEALDQRGCLYFNEMEKQVRAAIGGLRLDSGKVAPIPGAFGDTRHNLLLAQGLDGVAHTGFSPALLGALAELVATAGQDIDVGATFDQVCERSGLSLADGYRGRSGVFRDLGPRQAVGILAEAWHRPTSKVEIPLAEFVWRVAQGAGNAPALNAWLDTALKQAGKILLQTSPFWTEK